MPGASLNIFVKTAIWDRLRTWDFATKIIPRSGNSSAMNINLFPPGRLLYRMFWTFDLALR